MKANKKLKGVSDPQLSSLSHRTSSSVMIPVFRNRVFQCCLRQQRKELTPPCHFMLENKKYQVFFFFKPISEKTEQVAQDLRVWPWVFFQSNVMHV